MAALFISSRIVSRFVAVAGAHGVPAADLCAAASLDPAIVADIDGRIPIATYFAFLRAVRERVPDPALAFEVAATWSESQNLLRFVCRSSPNVGDAIERAGRFLHVVTNAASWPVERKGTGLVLGVVRHASAPAAELRLADELSLAELVTLIRAFTGVEAAPLAVRFTLPPPPPVQAHVHRDFFRCPVHFGATRTEIELSAETLALPLLDADPAALAFFEPYVEKLVHSARDVRTTADEVRETLAANMRGTVPSLEEVAERLATGGRTLRRRLQSEGTSFQQLVDETRFAVARHHIAAGDLPLATIAFLLGFSEASAFYRAFRRWTGTTPQAYARGDRIVRTPDPGA